MTPEYKVIPQIIANIVVFVRLFFFAEICYTVWYVLWVGPMESAISRINVSATHQVSWLEAENIAKKITSKTNHYIRKIDHVQAKFENFLIERIVVGRLKKAVNLFDDEHAAYNYLQGLRRDFSLGRKGKFNLLSVSSVENFFDGGVGETDDLHDCDEGNLESHSKPLLLYVAGGGFILPPSPKQARMVKRLAQACGCNAVLGTHRLAPENPFPIPCEDIADQYENLLNLAPHRRILVAADTAGASILLGALQILRDRKKPLPAGVLLFSPWCDLSLSGWSYVTRSISSVSPFRMESAAFCARLYLKDELATHPVASPVYADFDGFPKLCIHTSKHDIHFDDAVKLAENAHKARVHVKMNYWDTPRHHLERLPSKDAKNSFAIAAKFVEQCVA